MHCILMNACCPRVSHVQHVPTQLCGNDQKDAPPSCREGESKANLQHGAELSTAKNPAKTLESDLENADKEPRVEEHKPQSWISKAGKLAMHGMNVDIHHRLTRDDRLRELHERAEIFSPRVEYTFKYLQVGAHLKFMLHSTDGCCP